MIPEPNNRKIHLAVAENHLQYREMICRMLEPYQQEIQMVGEASNAHDAIKLAQSPAPDVFLLDLQMQRRGRTLGEKSCRYGIEAIREINRLAPTTHVLVISSFGVNADELYILFAALQAGISGFINKRDEPDGVELARIIRRVIHGEYYYSLIVREPVRRLGTLSVRETEVFELLARRYTNDMIADELVISEGTVKTHVSNLLNKLGLRSREAIPPRNDPLFFDDEC